MEFDDRRIGPEERLSGLSEGQRYALALILNLAFVGVVIAGFALLYTSGFGGGQAPGPEPESAPAAQVASAVGAPAPAGLILPRETQPASDIETAALPPVEPRAAFVAPGDAAGGPDAVEDEPEPADAEPVRLAALDPVEGLDAQADPQAAAPVEDEPQTSVNETSVNETSVGETSVDEAPVEEAAVEDEPAPVEVAALEPRPRLAPRVSMTDATPTASAAPALDPTATLWSAAGQLAANLQRDFPCSRFSLQADSSGEPTIQARVGYSEDIDRVRARVDENFADRSNVEVGLGCTTVIGGGYVALSDANGRLSQFNRENLSREIRAALPGEGTCAVIGQVVATQPQLLLSLSSGGSAATWVRSGGEPALCEETPDGMWQVIPASSAAARSAAALMLADDLTAIDARRAVNLGPPPESAPATSAAFNLNTAQSAPPAATTPVNANVLTAPAAGAALPEVAPIEGPAPRLPPDAEPSTEGYAVSVAFDVGSDGQASNLSVVGAGMAGLPVVAAALEVVSTSRFPATGSTYRATYTVRFPSAEFQDLLARLSLATAEERNASPVWDRSPSQSDYDRVYPLRALRQNIDGEVAIDCLIGFDGKLACSVARESPRGWGFGEAALKLSELMQASPRMSDNGPSANESVTLEFQFTAEGL